MSLHVIIPARWGSSRFPGKPLVKIAGRPMIQHVMERVSRAADVATVAVATDDERIVAAVEEFGGQAIMTPSQLNSGSDRVAAAASALGLGPDEMVANVQGDQPLLPHQVLEQCAAPLLAEPELGMSTPVVAITRPEEVDDVNHVKVVMGQAGDALYFSRLAVPFARDGEAVTHYKHLGVYLFRKWFLDKFASWPPAPLERIEKLEQLRVLEQGHRLRCVITEFDSPEVDRPQDADRVAHLLQERDQGW